MPKGYFLSAHRSEGDPVKKTGYAKLAIPAIERAGGRILGRGGKVQARENGRKSYVALIEFESYEAAIAAYESAGYQEAIRVLDGGADRDMVI